MTAAGDEKTLDGGRAERDKGGSKGDIASGVGAINMVRQPVASQP